MCGINGIVDFSSSKIDENVIKKMNDQLQHRGPDDEGIWSDEHVALGHRRLSIIDIDQRSAQPMTSEDKRYTLVFNGEIYNYQKIKADLEKDYTFKTESDTEVVLAAFIKWGEKCVYQFNGMFAFAVYDSKLKQVSCFRDRMGIKPFYYAITGGKITFSSSVKSILASGNVNPQLNESALYDYLRFQTVHQPYTIVENIFSLPAATFMKFNVEGYEIEKYWDIRSVKVNDQNYNAQSTAGELKNKLIESVERRLISDVPFGAFLSGGIDSSVIAAAMTHVKDPKEVNTFSVVFDDSQFNEQVFSQAVSKRLKTIHHEIKVQPEDLLESIEPALSVMDHPSGDGPNTYLISKATKDAGITVALSGLGSDEIFGGYPVFDYIPKIRDKKWLMSFSVGIRKLFADANHMVRPSIAAEKMQQILRQEYLDTEYIYQFSRQVLLDKEVKSLVKNKKLPANRVFEMLHSDIAFQTPGFHMEPKAKISYSELSTYLQHTLLRDTDQMSMAHALEVRVPFLDHTLLEWVSSLPDYVRYGNRPKGLLIDAFKDELPEMIYNRPKMGFVLPYEKWMKRELKSFCEEQLNYLKEINNFEPKGIENLWKRFLNNDKKITWSRVWHLVVLGYWLKNNGIKS